MSKEKYSFSFDILKSIDELPETDRALLEAARTMTANAYAPYSKFYVGAVARLASGNTVSGTNQENASSPVGICAERVLLSTASSLFPDEAIDTLAISYHNRNAGSISDKPVSPCGMCRQALVEYEERTKRPIRLLLSGMAGEILVIEKATNLLPFSFGSTDLK